MDDPITTECDCEYNSGPQAGTALIAGVTFSPTLLPYANVDGLAIFEGDIVLGPVEALSQTSDLLASDEQLGAFATTTPGLSCRWTYGIIPYDIDADLPNPGRVTTAIANWEANTPVQFVLRTADNAAEYPNYVHFQAGQGCNSQVGCKWWGLQAINLASNCSAGNVIHEIGHAVGLWHEQSRRDRDTYVRIEPSNIDPSMLYNFDQEVGDDIGPYDYGSIMHYGPKAFSDNGQDTIVALQPLPPNVRMGQRVALSQGDVDGVKALLGSVANQTFHATVYAVASQLAGWAVSHLTDPALNFAWSSLMVSADGTCQQSVTLDMGYPQAIRRVVLYPRWDTPVGGGSARALCFPIDFTLEASTNATRWTTLATYQSFPPPTSNAGVSFPVTPTRLFRYLRLSVTKTGDDGANHYVQLLGIEVCGAGPRPVISDSSSALGSMPITSLTDGDVNTAWSSTALASAETSQQVTLDLGANQSFNRVVLYPRWDTDGDAVRCFPISFQLNGSTDADGWTKLAEYANFAPPALNVGVSLPVTLPPDTYYRYLQLQISQESADQFGTYYVQLAEIEVYQGCWTLTVAGQSSFVAPNVPTNLTNTNLDTYWSSVKLASDSCNEWVLLHCSYPRMPLRLVLHPRWASPGSEQPARALCFPVAFTVQGSIGDGNWDILATFTDFPTPVFNAGVSLPLTLSNLYQYLRLNVTQTGSDGSAANQYFVQLAEIAVYLPEFTSTVAGFSSQFDAVTWPASHLIDRDLNTYWSSGEVAADGTCNEWVTLDLQYPRPVSRAILYPRWEAPSGGGNERSFCFPVDFALMGSNDNTTWACLARYTNFPVPLSAAGISLPLTPESYRYLQVVITKTGSDEFSNHYVQLAEIEVLS